MDISIVTFLCQVGLAQHCVNLSRWFLQHFILSRARPHCFFTTLKSQETLVTTHLRTISGLQFSSFGTSFSSFVNSIGQQWLLHSLCPLIFLYEQSGAVQLSVQRSDAWTLTSVHINGVQHTTVPSSNIDMLQMSHLLHCFCMSLAQLPGLMYQQPCVIVSLASTKSRITSCQCISKCIGRMSHQSIVPPTELPL